MLSVGFGTDRRQKRKFGAFRGAPAPPRTRPAHRGPESTRRSPSPKNQQLLSCIFNRRHSPPSGPPATTPSFTGFVLTPRPHLPLPQLFARGDWGGREPRRNWTAAADADVRFVAPRLKAVGGKKNEAVVKRISFGARTSTFSLCDAQRCQSVSCGSLKMLMTWDWCEETPSAFTLSRL